MTKKNKRAELEDIFTPISEEEFQQATSKEDGSRMSILENLQVRLRVAAIYVLLDIWETNKAECPEYRKALNHLWKAYVIATGHHGLQIIPPQEMVRKMKIPNAVPKKKKDVQTSGPEKT